MLGGSRYNELADVFSFVIILCELVAREVRFILLITLCLFVTAVTAATAVVFVVPCVLIS